MADTYTTEAIACGLSDVAGFVPVPRGPTPEMLAAFWRTKNTGTTEIGGSFQDDSDYAAYRAMIAAAPSHPCEADRVGLGELERLLDDLRAVANRISLRNEHASGAHIYDTVNRIQRLCERSTVPASIPALGTREGSGGAGTWAEKEPFYQFREIGEGQDWQFCSKAVYDSFARDPHMDTREVPASEVKPHPQAPNTLSEVEEGDAALSKLAAAIDAADHGYSITLTALSDEGSVYTLDLCDGSELLTFGDRDDAAEHALRHRSLARARAALATLRASQEQDGEVRS